MASVQDIIKLLQMNQPGSPAFRQWVMSFQRPNLRLSVQLKASGGVPPNLAGLVAEAQQGSSPGPTLIYAQTTNEVDTLTAHLQAKGVKAVKCVDLAQGQGCRGTGATQNDALHSMASDADSLHDVK
jgi:superfamily II DNA helicase RecQ